MSIQYVYPNIYLSGVDLNDQSLNFKDQNNSVVSWGGSLSGIDEGISSPNDADFIYPSIKPFFQVGSLDNGYFDFKYDQANITTSGIDVELRIKSSGYNYAVIAEVYDGNSIIGTSNYSYFLGNQIQSNIIPITIFNPKSEIFDPIVRYKVWTSGVLDNNPNSNIYITASDLKISGEYIAASSTPLMILGGLNTCQPEYVNYVDLDNTYYNQFIGGRNTYSIDNGNRNTSQTGSNLFNTTTNIIPSSIFDHSLFLINEGSGTVFYSCNSNVSGTINVSSNNIWDFNGTII